MEARGYVEDGERSSIYELKYKYTDYSVYSLLILIFIFSIVTRILF
jgi:energy-coupling factor transporter transmembrane protein EcfT